MEINLLAKKTAAIGLSMCMLGGLGYNVPVFTQSAIVANAEDTCYTFDSATGRLTLRGNIDLDEIRKFANKSDVKSIVCEQGAVLPEICIAMFMDFSNCEKIDLSKADAGQLQELNSMFSGCKNLTSLDLSSFDTSNVTFMISMFENCKSLETIDLSNFDTSNVIFMGQMFCGCENLKSIDLSNFNTSNVKYIEGMFRECKSLTSLDLSNFDTRKVEDISNLFRQCENIKSFDLSNFDTSNVVDFDSMFNRCKSLTSLDLKNFNTSKAETMNNMFFGCENLESVDLSSFDTSNVTEMMSTFEECSNLTSIDLSNFDTSNVNNMQSMFVECSGLTSLDLSSFDTSNVTNMMNMFKDCPNLATLDLSNFDTGNVTDMQSMFEGCNGLTSIDLSSFDTSNVTNMQFMFEGCHSLTSLDLSSFDASNVTTMRAIFNECSSLTSLDLSNFDISSLDTNSKYGTEFNGNIRVFKDCNSLKELTLSPSFNEIDVSEMLPNADGWVNKKTPETIISGSGQYAEFKNTGTNTYERKGEVVPQVTTSAAPVTTTASTPIVTKSITAKTTTKGTVSVTKATTTTSASSTTTTSSETTSSMTTTTANKGVISEVKFGLGDNYEYLPREEDGVMLYIRLNGTIKVSGAEEISTKVNTEKYNQVRNSFIEAISEAVEKNKGAYTNYISLMEAVRSDANRIYKEKNYDTTTGYSIEKISIASLTFAPAVTAATTTGTTTTTAPANFYKIVTTTTIADNKVISDVYFGSIMPVPYSYNGKDYNIRFMGYARFSAPEDINSSNNVSNIKAKLLDSMQGEFGKRTDKVSTDKLKEDITASIADMIKPINEWGKASDIELLSIDNLQLDIQETVRNTTTTTLLPTTAAGAATTTTTAKTALSEKTTSATSATSTTSAAITEPIVSSKYKLGDINGDNIIDGRDATDILTEYAKTSTGQESKYNEEQKIAADTTKDGVIDGRDATLILTFYAYTSTGHSITLEEYILSQSTPTISDTKTAALTGGRV